MHRFALAAVLVVAAAWAALPVEVTNPGTAGTNPYFVLEPGLKLHFRQGAAVMTLTVLAQTRTIDGVETRVVEDQEEKSGTPLEITRDYYALVTGHEGSSAIPAWKGQSSG